MASSDIKIKVSKEVQRMMDTSISVCLAQCYYSMGGECQLKTVLIDKDGKCAYFKEKDDK